MITSAHHTIRSVSLGTFWRMLRYPFVALSAIFIPRMMGDTVYGQYAFFLSVYLMVDTVADVGITQICGRFLPEIGDDQPRRTRFLYSLLAYGLVVTIAVIAGCRLVLWFWPSSSFQPGWWPLLVAMLVATKLEGTLFAFLYGSNQIGRYSAKELARSAALLCFVLLLFPAFGLIGALAGILDGELFLLGLAGWWTRHELFRGARGMKTWEFAPFWIVGLQFYIPMLLFGFLQRSGNLFIETLTGRSEQVAYYDVANQFLLLTATFLGVIFSTLLPALTAMHLRDEQARIQTWNRTVMTYCGVAGFLAFLVLAMLGEPVIMRWLGAAFAPVYPAALVLSAGIPFILLAYAGANVFLLRKQPLAYAGCVLAGAIVMTLGSLVLVPRSGAIGAAWASVAGYAAMAGSMLIVRREHFAGMLGGLLRAVLPGAICVPLYFWRGALLRDVALCAAGIAAYLFALLLLRIVRIADVRSVLATMGSSAKSFEHR